MHIADVLLPLSLPGTFSYEVPEEFLASMKCGVRVLVNFGKKKIYTGIVVNVEERSEQVDFKMKPIFAQLDEEPFISEPQLKLWNWMSAYYCCNIGDVLAAAIPGILLPTSESKYVVSATPSADEPLVRSDLAVYNALALSHVSELSEIIDVTGLKNPLPALQRLVARGLVSDEQVISKQYKPVERNYVLFSMLEAEQNQVALDKIMSKNGKQKVIIEALVDICQHRGTDCVEVEEREILERCDASKSSLQSLQKYGLLHLLRKVREQCPETEAETGEVVLSDAQQSAFDEIETAFSEKLPVLLHGVTSSGKTEIYMKLIRETLNSGRKVLYLLPEIAITAQIISRLEKYFGTSVKVYHSRHTSSARAGVYNAVLGGKYEIILGVRSAIFLPFDNLGLVIVDEEHENSYKQFDPDPRYNARDMALVLGKIHGANVILGSATPSVESYSNARQGRYRLVELTERFGNVQLPVIEVADMKDAYFRKINKGHFHPMLISAINATIAAGEQVILFQNRRGYSAMLECKDCGYVPHCSNCNVSLTLHKFDNKLVCHYCGEKFSVPTQCPNCGSTKITAKGLGTEKIEEQVQSLFPTARLARLDYDTAQSRKNYERIIAEFADGEIDILIGTQMITKGLDFPNVGLVGILNADNMLNFPDFRAFERSYQLMAQVSGRAGRRQKRGKVIIQTFSPDHEIIADVLSNNYKAMFENQMREREQFHYPPLCSFIVVHLKHRDFRKSLQAASVLAKELRAVLQQRVRGPEEPAVNRISSYYIMNVHVRFEKTISASKVKSFIMEKVAMVKSIPELSQVAVEIDVDPY
ncbi:MAG: primosomal protein N' [Bacteroidales bacterium]|nr:primosomal protein N' [Bacteroidales bacterium]